MPRTWQDRIVQYPKRFKIIDNNDGTVTLDPQPGNIIQVGTPVNATNLNGIENDITENLSSKDPVTAILQQGINIITPPCASPTNIKLDGRHVVNLLGRDGNCEDVGKWNSFQATLSLDSSNKMFGSNGIKGTLTVNGSGNAYTNAMFVDTSKYYCVSAYVKNGNATSVYMVTDDGSNGYSVGTSAITATDKFYRIWNKLSPSQHSSVIRTIIQCSGSNGQIFYMDGVMLHEITQAEYNDANYVPPDYVDSVQPIRNPYVIKRGKNLLPPFNQWTCSTPSVATVVSPYELTIVPTAQWQYVYYDVPFNKNTQYTYGLSNVSNDFYGYVQFYNKDGTQVSGNYYEIVSTPVTFTTPNTGDFMRVGVCNRVATGTFTWRQPMLNVGSTALTFEAQNDDYLFMETDLYTSEDIEEVNGQYVRNKKWDKVVL